MLALPRLTDELWFHSAVACFDRPFNDFQFFWLALIAARMLIKLVIESVFSAPICTKTIPSLLGCCYHLAHVNQTLIQNFEISQSIFSIQVDCHRWYPVPFCHFECLQSSIYC